MELRTVATVRVVALVLGMASGGDTPAVGNPGGLAMILESSAFSDQGDIPARHTCDGANTSPPLSFSGLPPGVRSLALIVDDPDAPYPAAPRMTWVHWVVYNLPADLAGLGEAALLPAGAAEGLNDWHQPGYRGPCPPVGRHRYIHKLYALDRVLPDLHQPTKARLEEAMRGHVLGEARLTGHYRRRP